MLVQTKEVKMKPEDVARIFHSEEYNSAADRGLLTSFNSDVKCVVIHKQHYWAGKGGVLDPNLGIATLVTF